jgi:hypothetical protein
VLNIREGLPIVPEHQILRSAEFNRTTDEPRGTIRQANGHSTGVKALGLIAMGVVHERVRTG